MFDLKKILNGRMNVPEPEIHIAGENAVITPGMALTLSGGELSKCAATVKPTHISIGNGKAGDRVAVYSVGSDMIFETGIPEGDFDAKAGDKVTLDGSGLGVTNTTTSGVAIIVSVEPDRLLVRF